MKNETETQVQDQEPEENIGTELESFQQSTSQVADAQINALVGLAERLPAIKKAQASINAYIFSIAYTGDWVGFKGPQGDVKVELIGAGAERVARDVGISYGNKQMNRESGEDEKGKWYRYWFEYDFWFKNRKIDGIEGSAGSRDKFFGYENKQWKELSDVNEMDVRRAARRNCIKEGVKALLGLRHIPIETAVSMGLDRNKIKVVSFQAKVSADVTSKPGEDTKVTITVANVHGKTGTKKDGSTWHLWTITDGKGVNFRFFAGFDSKRLLKLKEHAEDQTPINITFVATKSKSGGDYYELKTVEGVSE